jgi:hypothetical protein
MSTVECVRKLSDEERPFFYGWLVTLGITKSDFVEGTVDPFGLAEEFHGQSFSEDDLGQFALRYAETIEPAAQSDLL